MAKKANRVRGGVKKDIKSSSSVPFKVDETNKFNLAKLKEVKVDVRQRKDEDVKTPVLVFHFTDGIEEREHYHTEWAITDEWETTNNTHSVDKQIEWQDTFLAHIYNTFCGDGAHGEVGLGDYSDAEVKDIEFPEGVSGELLEGWYLFFWKVAQQFTSNAKGKPVTVDAKGNPIVFWLKLVYDKKDNLQLPKFPNFMDRYKKGKETTLQMGRKDKYSKAPRPSTTDMPAADTTTAISQDDLPEGF